MNNDSNSFKKKIFCMVPIKSGKIKYKVSTIEVNLTQGESTLIWCTSSLVGSAQ